MEKCILALDCSLRQTNIAVFGDGLVLASYRSDLGRRQAAELPLLTERTLAQAGIGLTHLSAIAVTCGPGYFTGIRVGAAYATGLAFGLEIGVIPVPTLEMLAYTSIQAKRPILAVVYAGQGCVYAASFGCGGDLPTGEYRKETLLPWLEAHKCAVVSDDPERACASVPLPLPVNRAEPDAEAVAKIAWGRQNQALSPMQLRINYHRDPDLGKPKS